MNEKTLFAQLRFIRMRTIAALDATSEENADKQPAGFTNNIRWNLGHIFVAQENLLYAFIGEKPPMPEHFLKWFNRGTSPQDWDGDLPSLEELRQLLKEQPDRMEATFTGQLNEKGPQPFALTEDFVLETIEDAFHFVIWHEGIHQGTITGLKHAIGDEELFKVE
ncbi:DinB family protein [Halalkalibacillus sediminis]|uniref:DinB family protein n=1 Tax=Halalkalibacillus sediminis TaxID=2018042 RepID=A0A2I0QVN8_9BACI|nr:DinB family protein [Halalkalibacillus sediminis]PKR78388.1 DinB family protein [Halalkalibacillus sediminis]